jgi:hypothetical protein
MNYSKKGKVSKVSKRMETEKKPGMGTAFPNARIINASTAGVDGDSPPIGRGVNKGARTNAKKGQDSRISHEDSEKTERFSSCKPNMGGDTVTPVPPRAKREGY